MASSAGAVVAGEQSAEVRARAAAVGLVAVAGRAVGGVAAAAHRRVHLGINPIVALEKSCTAKWQSDFRYRPA